MPWEFWRLTPAELQKMLEAAQARDRRTWWQVAFHACTTINIHLKRAHRMTPERMLGWTIKSSKDR